MARRPGPIPRERRLQAIGAYLDTPGALLAEFAADEVVQRIRTFSQASPDDLVAALELLGRVRGLGLVVHGPRGCAASLVASAPHAPWAVTGLDQRDTIMGSGEVLSRTVVDLARRHRPWAICIVLTPVVAINADDGRDVLAALAEEIGIPVLLVRTDGFRSRIAATGYDVACHALLGLVPATTAATEPDLVNLFCRDEALALAAAELLSELSLVANVLPAGADQAGFRRASQARLSLCLDPEATEVLARGVQAGHGVPLLSCGVPIGLAATQAWLTAIATATGRTPPTPPAERPAGLAGVRVHLALPPDAGFAAAILVGELGGIVAGLSVDHFDISHQPALEEFTNAYPGVALHVAAGQPFELVNQLASRRPDLFIGPAELAALAAAAGVPAVGLTPAALVGWAGAARLAARARKALANRGFVRRLAAPPPYAASWLRRSADWHVKQEVR
jgi:nitrogenase molybdenum-iron protein alpha/beta subunit